MDEIGVNDEERAHRQDVIKQRSIQGMQERWRQQDREALDEAVARHAPPSISEPRCDTCMSPHRLYIERQLVLGLSYAAISKSIPNGPDRRSISNHYKNHMPIDSAVVRAVLEEEAGLINQNVEEGIKGAFSNRGALQVLIRKAYNDAIDGITTVEPKDLIKMIELFDKIDASSASKVVEQAKAQVALFMDAIKTVAYDAMERDEADRFLNDVVREVQRLRELNEFEFEAEQALKRTLPSGS